MNSLTSIASNRLIEQGRKAAVMLKITELSKLILLPFIGIAIFLVMCTVTANSIETSLGKFPGPVAVVEQFENLYSEHVAEREKAQAFYQRQDERNAARTANDPNYVAKIRGYTGKETFWDQIITSLITVMSGFLLAAIIAIPLGIWMGLSRSLQAAINPIIQIFKPVSPLAWLPLVTMVVSAVYVSPDPIVSKSFINSMLTVTLCSVWPMIINTAIGVSSIDSDLINVSKVLRLSAITHVQKIVLPASIPMIL